MSFPYRPLGFRSEQIHTDQVPQAAPVRGPAGRAGEAARARALLQPHRGLVRHRAQGHRLLQQHQVELLRAGRGTRHQERQDQSLQGHQADRRQPSVDTLRDAYSGVYLFSHLLCYIVPLAM